MRTCYREILLHVHRPVVNHHPAAPGIGSPSPTPPLGPRFSYFRCWLCLQRLLAGRLLRTIYFGFTDASLTNLEGARWIGFGNYFTVLSLPSGATLYDGLLVDPAWWRAVWNTVRFTVISVTLETVLGMIVALVLNAEFKGRGIVRAAILIPWAIPTIVSAKMWAWMLNDQFGILNDMLLSLGLIGQKIAWTASPDTAMIAVAHRRCLEDDAVHGAAHPRRPADDARRHLRGGRDRRRPSGQGVLEDDAAADPAGADGRGDLPRARCAAHLRPDLRADAE